MDNLRSCYITDSGTELFCLNLEFCPKLVALGTVKITKQETKRKSILRIDILRINLNLYLFCDL